MAVANFNINDFAGTLEDGDLARSNLFYVDFIQFGERFSQRCRTATFPSFSVGNIEVGYMGRSFNLGGDRSYGPWETTFFNDPSHAVRSELIAWQSLVHSHDDSITGASPAEYKKDVMVYQYKRNTSENPTIAYMLVGTYPQEIGEISLGWDLNNRVQEFPVTFRFDYIIEIK